MKTAARWLLGLTFLSSIVILVALACGLGRRVDGAPLRFERDPLHVPDVMQSGKEYDFDAMLINESTAAVRVIGARDYCASSCYSALGVPTVIQAGGRGHVTVHIKAGAAGDFSGDLDFYTDHPSQPTLTIRLVGTVREGEPLDSASHASNP
jgi:hypothetical protein